MGPLQNGANETTAAQNTALQKNAIALPRRRATTPPQTEPEPETSRSVQEEHARARGRVAEALKVIDKNQEDLLATEKRETNTTHPDPHRARAPEHDHHALVHQAQGRVRDHALAPDPTPDRPPDHAHAHALVHARARAPIAPPLPPVTEPLATATTVPPAVDPSVQISTPSSSCAATTAPSPRCASPPTADG